MVSCTSAAAGSTEVTGSAGARAAQTASHIQHWRRQRQQLQHNLQQTASRALECMSSSELERRLGQLCNDLMDYLATSHGSVYTRCGRSSGSRHAAATSNPECKQLLREIRLHLGRTTDMALRFNLRCETTPLAALQPRLHAELGKLNRTLCLRYALEEQLLELGSPGASLPEE